MSNLSRKLRIQSSPRQGFIVSWMHRDRKPQVVPLPCQRDGLGLKLMMAEKAFTIYPGEYMFSNFDLPEEQEPK
jgi:hypothetical protein